MPTQRDPGPSADRRPTRIIHPLPGSRGYDRTGEYGETLGSGTPLFHKSAVNAVGYTFQRGDRSVANVEYLHNSRTDGSIDAHSLTCQISHPDYETYKGLRCPPILIVPRARENDKNPRSLFPPFVAKYTHPTASCQISYRGIDGSPEAKSHICRQRGNPDLSRRRF